MVLQTDSIIDLEQQGIVIELNSGRQSQKITYLSETKQLHALKDTKITVTEFQELNISITQDGSHAIEIRLPEIEEPFTSVHKQTESFTVYEFGENNYYPWSNGKYIFEILINDRTYYGVLHVQSKNITEDEFVNMHQYLEDHLSGISRKYTDLTEVVDDTLSDDSADQLEYWLLKNVGKLISVLNSIESNYVATFQKTYRVERLPKHLDRKSIQWGNGAKGSIFAGQKHLNRRYQLTANTIENRFVKMGTLTILNAIKKKKEKQLIRIRIINKKIKDLEDRIDRIDRAIEHSASRRNISREDIYKRRASKTNVKRDLVRKQKLQQTLQEKHHYLESSFRKVNYLTHNTFWKYVSFSQNRNLKIVNRNYIPFKQLWAEFLNIEGDILSKESRQKKKPNEYMMISTPMLYEYYTFFQMVDTLTEMGFSRHDQNKGLTIGDLFSEILPNTTIQFEKDGMRIDLVYEQEIYYDSHEAISSEAYFFSRSNNRRPDLRIDLYIYDEHFEDYLYNSSTILEVKYRPLMNIYSDIGYTEEMNQLNEYRLIRRYCPRRESYIDGIDNVICVYPGNRQDIHFVSEAGTYLILRPRRENEFRKYMVDNMAEWMRRKVRIVG